MTYSPDAPRYRTVSQLYEEIGPSALPMPDIPDELLFTFEEAYEKGPAASSEEIETQGEALGAGAIALARRALGDTQNPAA